MKAVNDFRIKISDVPVYNTGIQINKYDVVYYTGINPGTYNAGSISQTVSAPFNTGYYYALYDIPSGQNLFYARPGYSDAYITPQWTQEWSYTPSYGSSVSFQSNLYSTNFGDNYRYNTSKNENSLRVTASLKFDGITDLEAKSISHFYQNSALQTGSVDSNEGLNRINISLFSPHEISLPSYITDISYQYNFDNVNSLTVNLESPFVSLANWKGKLIPFGSDRYYDENKNYFNFDYVFFDKAGSSSSKGFWYSTGVSKGISPLTVDSNWTKKFFFTPSMSNSISLKADSYRNELDKFYFLQKDGENPNLLELELSFDNRSDKEAKALLHYLESKNGIDIFEFDGVPNFTGSRNFYCPEWSHTYNYKDNNTVTARFVETLFQEDNTTVFNTLVFNSGVDFGYVPSGFAVAKDVFVFNSGTNDVYYQTNTLKESGRYSDVFTDTFVLNNNVDEQVLSPYESGVLTYVYYLTDDAGTGPDLDYRPVITGPSNFKSSQNILQFAFSDYTEGPMSIVSLTGRSDAVNGANLPTGPNNNNWLKHNKNCIAYPSYNRNQRKIDITTAWKPPLSGYFFEEFEVDLSSNFNFSSFIDRKTIEVERLNLDHDIYKNIYGSSFSGLASSYSTTFTGLELETDYYIRLRGVNNTYGSETYYTYASGVLTSDLEVNNADVASGITGAAIAINFPKEFDTITLSKSEYCNLNLHNIINENGKFGDNFDFYSGITVNIGPDTTICSNGYDMDGLNRLVKTGALIITGDYSTLNSGVTINLYNSKIIGKAGEPQTTSGPSYKNEGQAGLYVYASGDIYMNLYGENSYIAGGGAAGRPWVQAEVNDVLNSNTRIFDTVLLQKRRDSRVYKDALNSFFTSNNETEELVIYGGIGAGSDNSSPITNFNNTKVFVNSAGYDYNSLGYTLVVNTYEEKDMFTAPISK